MKLESDDAGMKCNGEFGSAHAVPNHRPVVQAFGLTGGSNCAWLELQRRDRRPLGYASMKGDRRGTKTVAKMRRITPGTRPIALPICHRSPHVPRAFEGAQ
jgi:hypothetical protein